MTPNHHKTPPEGWERAKKWRVPLDHTFSKKRLGTVVKNMGKEIGDDFLNKGEVPLIIKLVENPRYKTSKLFTGAVDLFTHDCIHIVLGRGLLLKDEAFVIGYTMGSAKKMRRWRRNLFMFFAKYLYPEGYKFREEERFIFNMGVIAGGQCLLDLSTYPFRDNMNKSLGGIRNKLGIDVKLLEKCYSIEKGLFK
tara:strand:+ start:947 stop:1528 length:582 start_codon:yes stop_codon:yes gene_type:complete